MTTIKKVRLTAIVLMILLVSGCALFFNRAPLARFTADPLTGFSPLAVHFDASGSSDPDGTILSYKWTFGDGSTGSGQAIDHTFTTGVTTTFTVELTVTDDGGSTGRWSQSINVQGGQTSPNAPTARISASPTGGYTPLTVAFDASTSTDPNGTIVLYSWDFGDGSTGTGKTIAHTYASTVRRDYTVTLTATDDDGETGTATATITVMVADEIPGDPPFASFVASAPVTIDDSSLPAWFQVEFDPGQSLPAPGYEIVSYNWNFGDGTTEVRTTNAPFTHLYSCAGGSCGFQVTLTVVDNQGLIHSDVKNVTVINN
jgi:PKD repeat protein